MLYFREREVFDSFHAILGLIVLGLFLWAGWSGRSLANGDAEANLIESYNLPSNFCASNRNKLRRSEYVRVIKHALPMLKDAVGDQITTVEFATRSGKTAQVNTQLLVLALGGSKPRVFCLRRILQALGSETNPTAWDVTTPAISRISWGS